MEVKMGKKFPYELMENQKELVKLGFWKEEIYCDLIACQKGEMTGDEFKSKYHTRASILCLDMTGSTETAMEAGELESFFRILDVQKVCGPVFRQFNACQIRAFADNFFVLFDDPHNALSAAFEVHRRIELFNNSQLAGRNSAECCIGIGFGEVYAIGVDQAMGDEMNRACKLGEDIARGFETLITERAYGALKERRDCIFLKRIHEKIPFSFYEVRTEKEQPPQC
jgi:class 3 adenylate cyclase